MGDLIEGETLPVGGFSGGAFVHIEAMEGVFDEGGLAEMYREVSILVTLPVERNAEIVAYDTHEVHACFGAEFLFEQGFDLFGLGVVDKVVDVEG